MQFSFWAPESSWCPPAIPDLMAGPIALDLETCDPRLNEIGPGGFRKEGHVVGIAIADATRQYYLPINHGDGKDLPEGKVWEFLINQLALSAETQEPVIFAKASYDLEWLWWLFDRHGGRFEPHKLNIQDIQISEPLMDEEQFSYSLDSLGKKYLKTCKDTALLKDAIASFDLKGKNDLWKLPSKFVGPYAEMDARLTYDVWVKQQEEIRKQGLEQIQRLEFDLVPVIHYMRRNGVRVDAKHQDTLARELQSKLDKGLNKINREMGCRMDLWSGPMLARLCDHYKIPYPRTPKGNPSFNSSFLDASTNPLLMQVNELRELDRLSMIFVKGMSDYVVGGRIHADWVQIATDSDSGVRTGTRTGRMACNAPNLQQTPKRSDVGKLIRAMYLPEEGERWLSCDYSQQEPRLIVHYAALSKDPSALEMVEAYQSNPRLDVYTYLSEAAGVERNVSKTLTLGRCYGMGKKKMAEKLRIPEEEAERIIASFDEKVPFVTALAKAVKSKAESTGRIRTLLGRHAHFDYWEPIDAFDRRKNKESVEPMRGEKAARELWKGINIKRAHGNKALNRLIQGSAADQTKMAMLKIWRDVGKAPLMAVHDELNYSISSEEEAKEIQHIMETCVTLKIPVVADPKIGDHW